MQVKNELQLLAENLSSSAVFGTGHERLVTLVKLKPCLEKSSYNEGFFNKSLLGSANRTYVSSFAFNGLDKLKGYAVVGFLAGKSENPDEMTDMGFALFETDGQRYSLIHCVSYKNAANSKNGIYLCPEPVCVSTKNGERVDVVLSCGGKLARAEKTFNGKTQVVEVNAGREMALFDIYEEEFADNVEKAIYRCFDKKGNELEYGGSILRDASDFNEVQPVSVTATVARCRACRQR